MSPVGTHRVDELAARKQPVPRALPGTADRPRPGVSGESPKRKRVRRPVRHWRRAIVGFVRTKRGRWTVLGVVCVAALILGMLAEGFFSSPAPAVSVPGGIDNGLSTPPASPLASKAPKKHNGGSGKNQLVTNPVQRLRNVLPDNPLNHLNTGEIHQVTIEAHSSGPMAVVGYLVPTGLGSTYGSIHGRRSWSTTEQALGGGYLAAMYLQTDKSGRPITCTVTVDGKVTSTQTTSGSYGRALCLG